jgi:hypothetical protein
MPLRILRRLARRPARTAARFCDRPSPRFTIALRAALAAVESARRADAFGDEEKRQVCRNQATWRAEFALEQIDHQRFPGRHFPSAYQGLSRQQLVDILAGTDPALRP